MIRLMEIGINLIQDRQIIIVDPKSISYAEKQAKRRITRIEQINCTTIYILVYYDIKIKKRIKHDYR